MKLASSLTAVGIAVGVAFQAVAQGRALPAACGPDAMTYETHRLDTPPAAPVAAEGEATLVFVSDLQSIAAPGSCHVVTRLGLDGKWAGANCASSYFRVAVKAGEHHLCADWQSKLFLASRPLPSLSRFVAEAGQTYYFRANMIYAQGLVSMSFEPLNADEGAYLTTQFPYSQSAPKR